MIYSEKLIGKKKTRNGEYKLVIIYCILFSLFLIVLIYLIKEKYICYRGCRAGCKKKVQ